MKFLFSLITVFLLTIAAPLSAEITIDVKIPEEGNNKNKGDTENVPTDIKPDVVQFKNKDKLHGEMISVIKDKGLLWKSEEALKDITFKTSNIQEIIRGSVSYVNKDGNTAVLLTNEDMLVGKLIKLDDKELLLDTTYAGRLNINRNMIKSIFPGSDSSSMTYRGPNKMEEWILPRNSNSNSNVNIKDGELVISGYTSAGRDMKLPDMSKIELEMNGMGNTQFQIQIYGSKVDRYPRNGYVLYFTSGYIYMQRYSNGSSNNIGNFRSREFQTGKGKIIVLANKKEKSITLILNDKITKTWTDTSWAGTGEFVTFINQSNGTVKLKNITVGEWTGKIPGKKASESDSENDTIKFHNDDVISGKLKEITEKNVTFKTEYADMNIPIERVKEIATSMDSRHRARRRADDIRLLFENGDAVTVELAKITGNSIEGESGNFGKANLKLNAFKKIQFNIYDD